jgi:hypothetical protein
MDAIAVKAGGADCIEVPTARIGLIISPRRASASM